MRKLSQIVSLGEKSLCTSFSVGCPNHQACSEWCSSWGVAERIEPVPAQWEAWGSPQGVSRWLGAEGISLVTPTGNSWQKPRVTLPHKLSKIFSPLLGIYKAFTGLRSWHRALGRPLLLYNNSWSSGTSNGTSPPHLHTWIIYLQNKLKTTGRAGNNKNSSYSSPVCTVKSRL